MTLERFVPGVFPEVPSQLVRPTELPATVLPPADVGLLPSVSSHVGLEVRALGVNLTQATSGIIRSRD